MFHFSDGDNSSESDSRECCGLLREHLLPIINMFGYCQVASAYGSGNFINVLHEQMGKESAVITSRVNTKDDIYDSLKTFFLQAGDRMELTLPRHLAEIAEQIAEHARREGLDFYPTIFEMLTSEQMAQVAAYGGFPQRYPHWRFGMEYERLRKQHKYGLSKIYEMVINNNPCYAYLLNDNMLVDHKTVIAHVYAHCDFFKNNTWFGRTNRRMIDDMANHATRIRRYGERHGLERVEKTLDTFLSLENLIDPHSVFMLREARPHRARDDDEEDGGDGRTVIDCPRRSTWTATSTHPRGWNAGGPGSGSRRKKAKTRFPQRPMRDVLLFLLQHAPMEDWEADVLSIIREEAYYFALRVRRRS